MTSLAGAVSYVQNVVDHFNCDLCTNGAHVNDKRVHTKVESETHANLGKRETNSGHRKILKRYFDLIKLGTINAGIEGLSKTIQCTEAEQRTLKKERQQLPHVYVHALDTSLI
jgi:hypothetical protein